MKIFTIILLITTACLIAVIETTSFRFKKSKFKKLKEQFFNPSKSWKNKFKDTVNRKGNAFFGSSFLFSFTTSFYDLILFILSSIIIIIILINWNLSFKINEYENLIYFFIFRFTWFFSYKQFYKYLNKK